MLPSGTRLYSADDHVIEPPNLWLDRLPAKFQDRAPRIVEVDGRQAWSFNGELAPILMGACRPKEGISEQGHMPGGDARFDEIRPGCYDPVERLKDMDIDQVWGQLCFPNYARFAGHRFILNIRPENADVALACTRAYNDFLLDEWCATDPTRLFGAAILPLNDLDAAVAEFTRVIDKGAKALAFSENPTVLGLPSIHSGHWDPLWDIANEAKIPVCMHIGSSSRLITTSADAPTQVSVAVIGINSFMAGIDWLFSDVFDRYPDLEIVLSEGGAGWVPYALERADKVFQDARFANNPELPLRTETMPSEAFKEHVYVCLVDETFALSNLDYVYADNTLWEGDFPHGDGLWPNNHEYLEKAMTHVPDDIALKIAQTNMEKLLHL